MILWVNFRDNVGGRGPVSCLARYPVKTVWADRTVDPAIQRVSPRLLCFDFHCPCADGLRLIQATKRSYPWIPILMFLGIRSEQLAIWALRARVWDYFVKPVEERYLLERVETLLSIRPPRGGLRVRGNLMPPPPIPRIGLANGNLHRVSAAEAYIEENFSERIVEHDLAELCGMSVFHFSRVFKQETGETFRDYLIRRRLKEAKRLLAETNANISEVLFSVGFNDPSHFTRIFKKQVGVSPLQYRKRVPISPGDH